MNNLAVELNEVLDKTVAGRLLSSLGRRIFFPRGIISQGAEAREKAFTANISIGMAYHKKAPFVLSAIADSMPSFSTNEIVAYAPTLGSEEIRRLWAEEIERKNPSLKPGVITLPVVVPGLTSGISSIGDLFLEKGKTLLCPSPYWDNYDLVFHERLGVTLKGIPAFDDAGGLSLGAIRAAIEAEAASGEVRLLLNFPHNPSGYSPNKAEADELVGMIKEYAEKGTDFLVISDDAYFGLFYEDGISKESLFGRMADLHERVLAVKIDGPTKEYYVWGLRIGFLTFASKGLDAASRDALLKKMTGLVRSSVSCSGTPAQSLLVRALKDPRTPEETAANFKLMQERYKEVKRVVDVHRDDKNLRPLPFNSGYFMCFRCPGKNAEKLRQTVLREHGIGAIAVGDDFFRVTFAGMEKDEIGPVFEAIYTTAGGL